MFCASLSYAQDDNNTFDEYVKENREFRCLDVSVPCSNLFVKYMKENKTDSVAELFRYWEEHCPDGGTVNEAKLIYYLTYGCDNGLVDSIPMSYINSRINFINSIKKLENEGKNMNAIYKENLIPCSYEFDKYVIEKATELKDNFEPGTMKHLLADFISTNSDSVYYEIQKEQYRGSFLQNSYKRLEDYYYNNVNMILNIGTGIWIPTGDLKLFGVRPEIISFSIGGKYKRFYFGCDMAAGPKMKCEPFIVNLKDLGTSVISENASKSSVDLIIGYDVIRYKRNEIKLLAGVGLEYLLVYRYPKDNNGNTKSEDANSLMLFGGVEYDVYISPGFSIGLRAKYNYTNYAKEGVIDMKGNSFNIMILFYLNQSNNTDILRKIKSRHADY